jgi:hypothetical protein
MPPSFRQRVLLINGIIGITNPNIKVKPESKEKMDKTIKQHQKKRNMENKPIAECKRKKRELKVELQVAYVPLPDDPTAIIRWRAGMCLLLELLARNSEQEQTARKPSLGGEHESADLLS